MRSVTGVLKGARKLLTTTGWVKGDDHRIEDGESKFCARGAVQIAAGGRIVNRLEIRDELYTGEPRVLNWAEVDLQDLDMEAYKQAMYVLDRVATKVAHERGWRDQGETCDVVGANDLPGSTLDDVLSIFDQAIVVREAEEVLAQFNGQQVETPAKVASVWEDDDEDDDCDC